MPLPLGPLKCQRTTPLDPPPPPRPRLQGFRGQGILTLQFHRWETEALRNSHSATAWDQNPQRRHRNSSSGYLQRPSTVWPHLPTDFGSRAASEKGAAVRFGWSRLRDLKAFPESGGVHRLPGPAASEHPLLAESGTAAPPCLCANTPEVRGTPLRTPPEGRPTSVLFSCRISEPHL